MLAVDRFFLFVFFFSRTSLYSVHTATTSSQYFPVRQSTCLLCEPAQYGHRMMLRTLMCLFGASVLLWSRDTLNLVVPGHFIGNSYLVVEKTPLQP